MSIECIFSPVSVVMLITIRYSLICAIPCNKLFPSQIFHFDALRYISLYQASYGTIESVQFFVSPLPMIISNSEQS